MLIRDSLQTENLLFLGEDLDGSIIKHGLDCGLEVSATVIIDTRWSATPNGQGPGDE
jgi:hypothetical protein